MSDLRKARIAKIHIAKKDLRLDDDVYRALLQGAVGKSSCADMTEAELDAVLEAFKARGWSYQAKGDMRQGTTPTGRLIRTLWRAASRERSESSLRAMIRRVLGLAPNIEADPDLLRRGDATKVIEALKAMKRTAKKKVAA